MPSRPFEILLVEDSPGDVWLTREILLQGSAPKNIAVVNDGEQAIDYLYRKGRYATAAQPDLILLDLNLPRRNGLEVLAKIKNDKILRAITVVVLTTSEAADDINAAYGLNANCYIVKPVNLDAFTMAIRGIEYFWMTMATLPTTLPPNAEDERERDEGDSSESGEASGAGSASNRRRGATRGFRNIRYSERHAPLSVAGCRSASRRAFGFRGVHPSDSRHRHR